MEANLYDDDILAWAEQQSELLRRASLGERVNGLDWPNLIDEVESVGRSQLQSCESLLAEALRHLLKAAAWPDSLSVRHWLSEAGAFLPRARRTFSPSMRQHLDVQALYDDLLPSIQLDEIDGRPAGPVPEQCPFSLDDLLARRPDLDALLARLSLARATPPS